MISINFDNLVYNSVLTDREIRFLENPPIISPAKIHNGFVATGFFDSGRLNV